MSEQKTAERFQITVIGQEGDQEALEVNDNEPCAVLLRQGLHELYGDPGPNPEEYDVVFDGKVIDPLSQTVAGVGITAKAFVSILPKTISRGDGHWRSISN